MAKFWRLFHVKIRAVVPQNDQDHRESWTGACQYYYHYDVPPSEENDPPSDSQQFCLMAKYLQTPRSSFQSRLETKI